MIINRLKIPIATARELENTNASVFKQQAAIDYIAMMADVEIPIEEDEINVREDQEVL